MSFRALSFYHVQDSGALWADYAWNDTAFDFLNIESGNLSSTVVFGAKEGAQVFGADVRCATHRAPGKLASQTVACHNSDQATIDAADAPWPAKS